LGGRATWPTGGLTRYATRCDAFRLPSAPRKRQAWAETMGADGLTCLPTLCAPEAPPPLRLVPAIDGRRRSWRPQDWPDHGPVRGRQAAELPPTAQLSVSPYAPDARFGSKRAIRWTGDKAPLTEPCEPETPGAPGWQAPWRRGAGDVTAAQPAIAGEPKRLAPTSCQRLPWL
jgi:transposase